MGRRQEAELYEDEYQEEERTRAAVPSIPPSYDDQFEDRTRSARESQLALEGLARSAERARAPRRSFVDAEELLETPHRPSFVAASERRSRVERPAPAPPPPTPRPGSRHSYVATSERADFASSLPDADEVTGYHERPAPRRPSQHPVSQRPSSQRPSSSRHESTYAPAIASSEIEEVAPVAIRPSRPAPEERSRPIDYEALKRYLFDDVPADSPEAAAMSPEDRSVSMQTPVATLAPRSTNKAFRPAMHSMPASMREPRPEIAPLARISHHAFRPQMQSQHPGAVAPVTSASAPHLAHMAHLPTAPSAIAPQPIQPSVPPAARASHIAFRPPMMTGPMLPAHASPMNAPVRNDSYADSSWIVPTPPFAPASPAVHARGVFKVTLSFVAAAITAVAALAVMIGAIVFMRTEDASPSASLGPMPAVAAPPVPAPVETTAPPPAVTLAAPVVATPSKAEAPKTETAKTDTAKKKKVAIAAPKPEADDDEDDAPPPPKKKTADKEKPSKPADKNLERMLADLGEQQLKNADK